MPQYDVVAAHDHPVAAQRDARRGGVCPAIVRNGSLIDSRDFSSITPPTRNSTMRGPFADTAARKLPVHCRSGSRR